MKMKAEAAAATVDLPTKEEVTVVPPKPSVVEPPKPSQITKEEQVTKTLEEIRKK